MQSGDSYPVNCWEIDFQVSFDGGATVEVMVAGGKEKDSRRSSEVVLILVLLLMDWCAL